MNGTIHRSGTAAMSWLKWLVVASSSAAVIAGRISQSATSHRPGRPGPATLVAVASSSSVRWPGTARIMPTAVHAHDATNTANRIDQPTDCARRVR